MGDMSCGVAGVRGSHKVLVMAWVRVMSGVNVRAGLSSSNPLPPISTPPTISMLTISLTTVPPASHFPLTHACLPALPLMGCCSCQVEFDPTSIRSTVRALQANHSDPDVAIRACTALLSLATDDANIVLIAESGGIQAILKAMTSNAGNLDVNDPGSATLKYLAANVANQVTIAAAEAIPVILNTMAVHASHAGVNESGCSVFLSLAANAANRVTIATAGAILVILKEFEKRSMLESMEQKIEQYHRHQIL